MEPVGVEQVVRSYFRRLFGERDLSVCDEVLADGYVDHDAPPGTSPGPGATRDYVAGMLREDPGLTVTVQQVVAVDRTVALTAVWRGTRRDTGESYVQAGLVVIRLDGERRFVERRAVYSPGS